MRYCLSYCTPSRRGPGSGRHGGPSSRQVVPSVSGPPCATAWAAARSHSARARLDPPDPFCCETTVSEELHPLMRHYSMTYPPALRGCGKCIPLVPTPVPRGLIKPSPSRGAGFLVEGPTTATLRGSREQFFLSCHNPRLLGLGIAKSKGKP